MRLLFRRKEIPWEVVDSRSVDPVYTYYEDDSEGRTRRLLQKKVHVDSCPIDFQIVAIKDTSITRTYLLDVKDDTRGSADLRKAVVFAREQLLQEAKENGYNILWLERYYPPYFFLEFSVRYLLRRSWQVTLLRKGRLYRVEVRYMGRRKLINNSEKPRNRIIVLKPFILIAARASNEVPNRYPPFMALLQTA